MPVSCFRLLSARSLALWNLIHTAEKPSANMSYMFLLTPSEKWISITSESFSLAVNISDMHGEITEWIIHGLRARTEIQRLLNMEDSELRWHLRVILRHTLCHYCGGFNMWRCCPSAARRPWEAACGVCHQHLALKWLVKCLLSESSNSRDWSVQVEKRP